MVEFLVVGTLLGLVQLAAALPWVAALDPVGFKAGFRRLTRTPLGLQVGSLVLLALVALMALYHTSVNDPDQMVFFGRIYASVLHLQLAADLFVLVFMVLLGLWPQGASVALAAFREGIRQPLFWILSLAGVVLMIVSIVIPYFTFGEDFKMVQEIGYDTIMLVATAFGVIAASMSISEEIEGKTAITLMSKPISRRQFLLGKFVGILLAALAMTLLLGWFLIWVLYTKPRWDPYSLPNPYEPIPNPEWVLQLVERLDLDLASVSSIQGILFWTHDLAMTGLGMVLGFCQLMVLLAIAVALATRMPMIVNLVICLIVFFLGHLTPILTAVSQNRFALVYFTAQLFDTLLPSLEFYDMGAAIVRDVPVPPKDFALYVGSVTLYSVVYTAIALLFGLILFEDRDLA
jgi:ABC-type transport system involved in multi-copper enzyme maturation permease subunit